MVLAAGDVDDGIEHNNAAAGKCQHTCKRGCFAVALDDVKKQCERTESDDDRDPESARKRLSAEGICGFRPFVVQVPHKSAIEGHGGDYSGADKRCPLEAHFVVIERGDRCHNEKHYEHIYPTRVIRAVEHEECRIEKRHECENHKAGYHVCENALFACVHEGECAGHAEQRHPCGI